VDDQFGTHSVLSEESSIEDVPPLYGGISRECKLLRGCFERAWSSRRGAKLHVTGNPPVAGVSSVAALLLTDIKITTMATVLRRISAGVFADVSEQGSSENGTAELMDQMAGAGVLIVDTGGVLVPRRFVERSTGSEAGFSHLITAESLKEGQIPQDDGLVVTGGGQGAPVGGEHHPIHFVGMAGQGLAELVGAFPVADIPQSDGLVVAAGG
jgi:hypothetical protein